MSRISEEMIRSAGSKGIMKLGKNGLQVVIGLNVQAVADALEGAMKNAPQQGTSAEAAERAEPPQSVSLSKAVICCKSGTVFMPVRGRVIPMEQIPDETFAAGILGAGVGIVPEDNIAYAPCDGTVISVTDTLHAVAVGSNGMEVLIHIGIDTVKMNGDGFECFVSCGDTVKAGQPLIRFDREKIRQAGCSEVIPVMLTNSDDLEDVICSPEGS